MRRKRQRLEDILQSLAPIEASWLDPFALEVVRRFERIPAKEKYGIAEIESILEPPTEIRDSSLSPSEHFEVGLTVVRLFLDMSRDEFQVALRSALGPGIGIKRFHSDRAAYISAIVGLGLPARMIAVIGEPVSWVDVLKERLKSGRGSAIKGQQRGRAVEDKVEDIVREIFGDDGYDRRCRFRGATGVSTEKCDFAIPTRDDPEILVEAKGYGATGSKQTDVLGDITRIVAEKRHDTTFLLVTDGVPWLARQSDLRKLLDLQNQGQIARIYTLSMTEALREDLKLLKGEKGL